MTAVEEPSPSACEALAASRHALFDFDDLDDAKPVEKGPEEAKSHPNGSAAPAAEPEAPPCPLHRVVVFNLDRRPARLESFLRSAERQGLGAITTRFAAFDGQLLDLSSYPRDVVTEHGIAVALDPPEKVNGVHLTRGALGLILSWHAVLRQIAEDPCDEHVYLIAEDDAVFLKGFGKRLQEALAEAARQQPKWDLMHVGYYGDDCSMRGFGMLRRPIEVFGLFGAALRPGGARTLLRELFPLREQIDSALAKVYGRVRSLIVHPPLMHADHSAAGSTDIQILPQGQAPPRYARLP